MKAIVLSEFGPASVLVLRDVTDPEPGPGEIKVRVAASSVNPVDWKLRSGALQAYMPLELPAILGRDVSGEVVALGPGVSEPRLGARVLGLVNRGYAELVVGPAASFAEVPAGLDLVDAAALPLVLLTGSELVDALEARPRESVLVTGATGSVGRVAVFCAKAAGATLYAGVRSKHEVEAAKLGVHGVVALDDDRQLDALPPMDALADTVGGASTQKVLGKLKPGARIGSVVGEPAGAKERGFSIRAFMAHPDSKRLAALASEVASGRLVIPIAERLPLAEAAKAHGLAEKGGVGKIVLVV